MANQVTGRLTPTGATSGAASNTYTYQLRSDVDDVGVITIWEPEDHPVVVARVPQRNLPHQSTIPAPPNMLASLARLWLVADQIDRVADSVPEANAGWILFNLVQLRDDLWRVPWLQTHAESIPSDEDAPP